MAEKKNATEQQPQELNAEQRRNAARRGAEAEKTVKVDLANSVGVSRGPYKGKLYGPGQGIEMPEGLAKTLGLEPSTRTAEEGGEDGDTNPNADVEAMNREELEAEAQRLEINIDDGRGENADGKYSVEQLRRKIIRKRANEADE